MMNQAKELNETLNSRNKIEPKSDQAIESSEPESSSPPATMTDQLMNRNGRNSSNAQFSIDYLLSEQQDLNGTNHKAALIDISSSSSQIEGQTNELNMELSEEVATQRINSNVPNTRRNLNHNGKAQSDLVIEAPGNELNGANFQTHPEFLYFMACMLLQQQQQRLNVQSQILADQMAAQMDEPRPSPMESLAILARLNELNFDEMRSTKRASQQQSGQQQSRASAETRRQNPYQFPFHQTIPIQHTQAQTSNHTTNQAHGPRASLHQSHMKAPFSSAGHKLQCSVPVQNNQYLRADCSNTNLAQFPQISPFSALHLAQHQAQLPLSSLPPPTHPHPHPHPHPHAHAHSHPPPTSSSSSLALSNPMVAQSSSSSQSMVVNRSKLIAQLGAQSGEPSSDQGHNRLSIANQLKGAHSSSSSSTSNSLSTSAKTIASMGARQPASMNVASDNLKPAHSYIGLIGMCILSSPDKRMVLNDIYQYILDHYPYYRNRGSGWRNSVRHNLSLNECFQKAGRAANGKGHYWTIHPANMEDFMDGDFRRRRAQRKVRRWNNMEVASDESNDESDSDETSRPPLPDHFKRSIEMHRRLELAYQKGSSHNNIDDQSRAAAAHLAAAAAVAAAAQQHRQQQQQQQQQQQHQSKSLSYAHMKQHHHQ